MSNVLTEDKRQQVLALGRLGWSLRRIERATGVRRETASGYLKTAGVVVRSRGRPSARPANPAISSEVSTDPSPVPAAGTGPGDALRVSGDHPSRAPPQTNRRCAPMSVHVRRNPCSRSPESPFNFTERRSRRVSLPCAVPGAQGEAANAGVLGSERIDQGRSPYPHLFQETLVSGPGCNRDVPGSLDAVADASADRRGDARGGGAPGELAKDGR